MPSLSPAQQTLKELFVRLLNEPQLAEAAEAESRKRIVELLGTIAWIQQIPYEKTEEPECVFTCGAARLLDYGAGKLRAPVIFLIPSLINRYTILDLTDRISFAKYLRDQGHHVFVVDWGVPSSFEQHFNCALYITEILVPMAEWIREHTEGSLVLGGYCMGGLLAMGLASIRRDLIDGLGLFATPWDFTSPPFPGIALKEKEIGAVEQFINASDTISAEILQQFFNFAHPQAVLCKLGKYTSLKQESSIIEEFLAVEQWVNDGLPMVRGAAKDCFIHFLQQNLPYKNKWKVGGQVVNPGTLTIPSFIAIADNDSIVPPESALPLTTLLKNHTLVTPHTGHIGMMVGRHRNTSLWDPFSSWLKRHYA